MVMRIPAIVRRINPLRLARLGLIVLLVPAANVRAAATDERTKLDCGVNALFILLRLEGRPVSLDRLLDSLPPRHPDGYSMDELTAASRTLGLELEGIRFAKGDEPPKRPAIAFVKDDRGGHFAVLRPVGTTGTMVQVIDPPSPPWIGDFDRIIGTKIWTGRILVAREPRLAQRSITAILIIAGFAALMYMVRSRRQFPEGRRGGGA
jgi:ABC-type bacteriocin/lantibiotic exporter with double-glycine peptidase domain